MVDGHLNFDTKINEKGFNKGIGSIGKGLGSIKGKLMGIGAVLGTVFSVQLIRNFSKEAKKAWETQLEAEARLEQVMRNTMNATDEQIKSVKEYSSALQELGVIGDEVQLSGLQELGTYVRQAESLKKMNVVLNDMLAQQYGLNATAENAVTIATMLGKVLDGQTSALSRYGYSFDEAQEKLLKYGTEEQRVATLAEVVEQSVGGMNAALANTDAGRMKQLENTMGDIKEQFGAAVTQIQVIFLPALKRVAQLLATAAQYARDMAQAMADVFGAQTASAVNTAGAAADAADSYEDMAAAAEEAQKANDKSLASFDQINKLGGDDTAAGPSSESSAQSAPLIVDTSGAEKNMSVFEKKLRGLIKKLKKYTKDFRSYFDKNFGDIFSKAIDDIAGEGDEFKGTIRRIFSDMGTQAEPFKKYLRDDLTPYLQVRFRTMGNIAWGLFDSFNMVFSDLWDVVVFPFLQNLISDGLPLLTQFSTQAWLTFDSLFADLKELFDTWWSEYALPILSELTVVWTDTVSILKNKWDEYGEPIFEGIREALTNTKDIILDIWEKWIRPVFDKAMEAADEIWKEHLSPLLDNIIGLVGDLAVQALKIYNKFIAPIVRWFADKLAPVVQGALSKIVDSAKARVKLLLDILNGFVTFLRGVFTGDMKLAWEGIKRIFQPVADYFKERFETARANISAAFSGLKKWATDRKNDVVNAFTGIGNSIKVKFNDAWTKIKSVFSLSNIRTHFRKIVDAIKELFKSMADAIKAPFNSAIDAINSAIDSMNDISIEFENPLTGSKKKFGFDLPKIPRLAQGMAVPANYGEFLAVLGDNRREPEVVSPVSTMEAAFRRVLSEFGGMGGGDIHITCEIDGEKVYKTVVKHNKRNVDATGNNEFIY